MKVWITVKERSARSCLLPGRAAGSAAEELPLQPPSPITQHQGNTKHFTLYKETSLFASSSENVAAVLSVHQQRGPSPA